MFCNLKKKKNLATKCCPLYIIFDKMQPASFVNMKSCEYVYIHLDIMTKLKHIYITSDRPHLMWCMSAYSNWILILIVIIAHKTVFRIVFFFNLICKRWTSMCQSRRDHAKVFDSSGFRLTQGPVCREIVSPLICQIWKKNELNSRE